MCVGGGVDEGVETVDRGYTPLPTRQQRFCDPASLFVCLLLSHLSFKRADDDLRGIPSRPGDESNDGRTVG